jgi:hypothetical protein
MITSSRLQTNCFALHILQILGNVRFNKKKKKKKCVLYLYLVDISLLYILLTMPNSLLLYRLYN